MILVFIAGTYKQQLVLLLPIVLTFIYAASFKCGSRLRLFCGTLP